MFGRGSAADDLGARRLLVEEPGNLTAIRLDAIQTTRVRALASRHRARPRIFEFADRRVEFFSVVLVAFLDERRRRRRKDFLGIPFVINEK